MTTSRVSVRSADVVVIGGGIIGAAAAYYLARAGVEVALFERGDLASGSTAAAQGGVRPELYDDLPEVLDSDLEYRKGQGLLVVPDAEGMDEARRYVADTSPEVALLSKERGLRMLTARDVLAAEPAIAPDIAGGVERPNFADVNPMATTYAFASAAKRLGARLYTYSEVDRIEVTNRRIEAVCAAGRTIRTPCVVSAAGVWASQVARLVGLNHPVTPRRGQVLVTERTSLLRSLRISQFGMYMRLKAQGPETTSGPTGDVRRGIAWNVKTAAGGACLIGSTRDFAGFDRTTTHDVLSTLARRTIRFIPAMRRISCIRSFAGWRQYTPDQLPILGESHALPRFLTATGFDGEGVALAPLVGRLICELVTSQETSVDVGEYSPARFEKLDWR